jgi:hypothetical protein
MNGYNLYYTKKIDFLKKQQQSCVYVIILLIVALKIK